MMYVYVCLLHLVEGGDSLLERVECVGRCGGCELSGQGLQLNHQAGIQRLQERRLRLLHLQTLYQLLQLQNRAQGVSWHVTNPACIHKHAHNWSLSDPLHGIQFHPEGLPDMTHSVWFEYRTPNLHYRFRDELRPVEFVYRLNHK